LQFEVFRNPNAQTRSFTPYIVVIQSDLSTGAQTAIAAPISYRRDVSALDRTTLSVSLENEECVVLLRAMAAVRLRQLRNPIARLPELAQILPRALDFLFLGV
jgi:toxin CcdB